MANSVDPDRLASKKPTDLDLYCLQRQGISGFSRTRVKVFFFYYSEKIRYDVSWECIADNSCVMTGLIFSEE